MVQLTILETKLLYACVFTEPTNEYPCAAAQSLNSLFIVLVVCCNISQQKSNTEWTDFKNMHDGSIIAKLK